jgi:hypothetical protein
LEDVLPFLFDYIRNELIENKVNVTKAKEPPMKADTISGEHLKSWTPGTYRISVEGQLDEKWSERLAGMDIKSWKRADQSVMTTLEGNLRDQSELLGVLNSLHELHLPLLKVECLKLEIDIWDRHG